MAASAPQIRKHIDVLTEFEAEYRAFVKALEEERRTGISPWSKEMVAEKRRKLVVKAPRADLAAKASRSPCLVVREPSAVGGGVRSDSLPAQIMDLDRDGPGAHEDGLRIPREILDYIPRQLGDLHLQLEEAEDERGPETSRFKHRLPTVVGHLGVPPVVGTVADIGGFATVIAFLGHVAGLW
jgi:hypothetical protein